MKRQALWSAFTVAAVFQFGCHQFGEGAESDASAKKSEAGSNAKESRDQIRVWFLLGPKEPSDVPADVGDWFRTTLGRAETHEITDPLAAKAPSGPILVFYDDKIRYELHGNAVIQSDGKQPRRSYHHIAFRRMASKLTKILDTTSSPQEAKEELFQYLEQESALSRRQIEKPK